MNCCSVAVNVIHTSPLTVGVRLPIQAVLYNAVQCPPLPFTAGHRTALTALLWARVRRAWVGTGKRRTDRQAIGRFSLLVNVGL